MRLPDPALLILPLLLFCSACVSEGHSAECGAGGQAAWVEVGCMTPIGGSCLSLKEFGKDRPKDTQDEIAQIAKDYQAYLDERPHCDP